MGWDGNQLKQALTVISFNLNTDKLISVLVFSGLISLSVEAFCYKRVIVVCPISF